jgi:hypothetical protein
MTVFTLSHYAYTEFSIIYFLITYKALKTRIKKDQAHRDAYYNIGAVK